MNDNTGLENETKINVECVDDVLETSEIVDAKENHNPNSLNGSSEPIYVNDSQAPNYVNDNSKPTNINDSSVPLNDITFSSLY